MGDKEKFFQEKSKHCQFSREFVQWVRQKDSEGLVCWFRDRDYVKLSAWIENIFDPISKGNYDPLILDPAWWRVQFIRSCSRYIFNPRQITASLQNDIPMDPASFQEFLWRSNPTMEPTVSW